MEREPMNLHIHPTVGCPFVVQMKPTCSLAQLKEAVCQRIGVVPSKVALLHCTRELKDGSLCDNNIQDESNLTLVLHTETGVRGAKAPESPTAALRESLSVIPDEQIDRFLMGKGPLSVSMRLGEAVVVLNIKAGTETVACGESASPVSSSTHLFQSFNGTCDIGSDREIKELCQRNCLPFPVPVEPCTSRSSDGNVAAMATDCDKGLSERKRHVVTQAVEKLLQKVFPEGMKSLNQYTVKAQNKPGTTIGGTFQVQSRRRDSTRHAHATSKHHKTKELRGTRSAACISSSEQDCMLQKKVALLKKRMLDRRLEKQMKREGVNSNSPCGWLEAAIKKARVTTPMPPPSHSRNIRRRLGYCGLRKGFLLESE